VDARGVTGSALTMAVRLLLLLTDSTVAGGAGGRRRGDSVRGGDETGLDATFGGASFTAGAVPAVAEVAVVVADAATSDPAGAFERVDAACDAAVEAPACSGEVGIVGC
jgi:hypothetical protein